MRLNDKGWGYRMMIFLMTILCIFLLISIYYIFRFYNAFELNLIIHLLNNGVFL